LLVFISSPLSLSLNPSLDVVVASNLNFYCFLLFTLKWLIVHLLLVPLAWNSLFLAAL